MKKKYIKDLTIFYCIIMFFQIHHEFLFEAPLSFLLKKKDKQIQNYLEKIGYGTAATTSNILYVSMCSVVPINHILFSKIKLIMCI